MMKEFNPYQLHTRQLLKLLDSCRTKKNPAWWLYVHKARTTLFMLESLSRVMYKTFNDDKTNKWRLTFKKLEDMLGKIDHYDALIKALGPHKAVGKEELAYLRKKREKAIKKLNAKLKKHDYYIKFMIRFSRSDSTNFNKPSLIKKLEEDIKQELNECAVFFKDFRSGFKDMEKQVHEFRRKLRWISIYAQSLQGIIVLKAIKKKYAWEKEFVSSADRTSPFNRLPVQAGLEKHIGLNRTAFYALSHVISRLGDIKDEGLAIEELAHAIKKTKSKKGDALQLATEQLKGGSGIEALLKEAHSLLHKFFITHRIHRVLTQVR
jgi:hypothetical protein